MPSKLLARDGEFQPVSSYNPLQDVAPAQEVVQRVAQAGGKDWEALVRAGVVDTLCQSVMERVMEYSCPFDMPAHVWKEVIEPVRTD